MGSAQSLFTAIMDAAGDKLANPHWMRLLIEAAVPAQPGELQSIGFTAKFLVKTWNVMRRLGAEDVAREQMKKVFQKELEGVRTQLKELSLRMPADDRTVFHNKFLAMTSGAFVELMALLQDLSWVKNVEIDRR